ncbi:hypothetical protein LTR16_010697, partial [Cryomyces antarcticus]
DSDDDEDEASPLKPDHERHSSHNQQNARPGDDSTSPGTRRSSANTSSTGKRLEDVSANAMCSQFYVQTSSNARSKMLSEN